MYFLKYEKYWFENGLIILFIIGFYNFVIKFCWNVFLVKEYRGIGGYYLFIF